MVRLVVISAFSSGRTRVRRTGDRLGSPRRLPDGVEGIGKYLSLFGVCSRLTLRLKLLPHVLVHVRHRLLVGWYPRTQAAAQVMVARACRSRDQRTGRNDLG